MGPNPSPRPTRPTRAFIKASPDPLLTLTNSPHHPQQQFEYNNQAPCNSASERDFGEFMRAASVEALRACEAELSKG